MMPGEPAIYDPNDHYRILESDDGYFFPQRKGCFGWKFYYRPPGKFVERFANYNAAKKFLDDRRDEAKKKAIKFKGKRFLIHKPY